MPRLHFLGAAGEVTGSMLLVEGEAGSVLVDCGMYQGHRADAQARNRVLPPAASSASAVLLTHAHIDHSGSLPTLVKSGFTGPIYCTPATRDVAALMLRDSARIQAADAAWLNRKHEGERDWEPVLPVYDEDDVADTLARIVGEPYHLPFHPLPGWTARLRDAGHILGAAHLHLEIVEGDRVTRLLVSGDLGRHGLPILRDPEPPQTPVDFLVMESTYGDRVHPPIASVADQLARIVTETAARGGRIIVPAFALGRAQELLYVLRELREGGRIPPIPVYVDSPLATAVTAVFKLHPDAFDREARHRADGGDLFDFPGVHWVATAEDSMALNEIEEPILVISASGMAESGRVLHHLRRGVGDPRNTIVIVGFMAEHTLGRRLAEKRPRVRIFGMEHELLARVEVVDAFSAHADRENLVAFARACGPVRRVFLVHGEPEAQRSLHGLLSEAGLEVVVPRRGQVEELVPAPRMPLG